MRLIDSDALLNEHCGNVLWGEYKSCAECYEDHEHKCYHEIDAQDIMDAPTIEAEPIVRCKDCKYFKPIEGARLCGAWEEIFYNPVEENGYCYKGERKNEAAE